MTTPSLNVTIIAPNPYLQSLEQAFLGEDNISSSIAWYFAENNEEKSKDGLKVIVDIDTQKITFSDKNQSFKMPIRIGKVLDYVTGWYAAQLKEDQIELGDYHFTYKSRSLKKQGKTIQLTEKEADLLYFLYQKNDHSASREDLLEHVWEYADGVDTHTIETHVYRLRQKMEKKPSEPDILATKDGIYVLNL